MSGPRDLPDVRDRHLPPEPGDWDYVESAPATEAPRPHAKAAQDQSGNYKGSDRATYWRGMGRVVVKRKDRVCDRE